MPLYRVDFECPKCGMFVKSDQKKVEVERTDTRVAYGHEKCYRVNSESWVADLLGEPTMYED